MEPRSEEYLRNYVQMLLNHGVIINELEFEGMDANYARFKIICTLPRPVPFIQTIIDPAEAV